MGRGWLSPYYQVPAGAGARSCCCCSCPSGTQLSWGTVRVGRSSSEESPALGLQEKHLGRMGDRRRWGQGRSGISEHKGDGGILFCFGGFFKSPGASAPQSSLKRHCRCATVPPLDPSHITSVIDKYKWQSVFSRAGIDNLFLLPWDRKCNPVPCCKPKLCTSQCAQVTCTSYDPRPLVPSPFAAFFTGIVQGGL